VFAGSAELLEGISTADIAIEIRAFGFGCQEIPVDLLWDAVITVDGMVSEFEPEYC
jgi:hypothetical protein